VSANSIGYHEQGRIKFEEVKKTMKIGRHSFLAGTNMVKIILMKGKAKVLLTLAREKESGAIDPKVHLSKDEFKEARRHHAVQESRCEQGENSKSGAGNRPHTTSQMLLNKYYQR
jgi:hypothetical protein